MPVRGKVGLQYKIFFSCAALIVLMLLVVSLTGSVMYTNANTQDSQMSAVRQLALITNNLDATLTHISDYAISVAVDEQVIRQAKLTPRLPATEAGRYALRAKLGTRISAILGMNRNIYMWDLLTLDNELFNISGYDLSPVTAVLDGDFYRRARAQRSVQIFGPYRIRQGADQAPVFLVTKPIVDLDSRKIYGLVMFVLRESSVSAIFRDNMPDSAGAAYYVLDGEGTVISATSQGDLLSSFQEASGLCEEAAALLMQKGSLVTSVEGVRTQFCASRNSTGKGWTLVSRMPMDALEQAQDQVGRSMLITGLAACLIALVVSFIIARTISRPIQRLAAAIHTAAQGDMKLVAAPRGGHEVNTLYVGFNDLIGKVNQLVEHIKVEQEEKSGYQFQLIQAQIKPHFLYNTLETIKSLIDLGMNETASECTSAMSTFYRLSLNKGRDILTVRDEVALSRQYMYIQRLRYVDYLDYDFDVPEKYLDYLLPKMTLQPILENAIYHGIKEKQSTA